MRRIYISPPQKAPKEPILEEAELDFRPLEECDEGLEEDGQPRETKNPDGEARRDPDRKQGELRGVETMSGILYIFFSPSSKLWRENINECILSCFFSQMWGEG